MDPSQIFSDCFNQDHLQYKKIFEGNQEFIQEHLEKDPIYFEKLIKGQTPKYLIIGCSDSRVPPNDLTKLKPGDIFNHRNIANQVIPADMNVNSVIQYAVESLKVKHVVVMGHTCCGGIKAAIEGNSYGGMLDLWLSHIKNVYEKYEDELNAIEDLDTKCTKLCELNVVEQVMNVWKNPYVQKSWKKGHPVWVHGWIFRVETGYLEEIIVETQMPSFLRVFQFKFDEQTPHGRQSHHHSFIQKSVRKSEKESNFNGYSSPARQSEKSDISSNSQIVRKTIERKSTSIWKFDDFITAQNELMFKTENDAAEDEKLLTLNKLQDA